MARDAGAFASIRVEGALVPAEVLSRLAAGDSSQAGLTPDDYHLAEGERLREAISRSWSRLLGAWRGFAERRATTGASVSLTREKWLQVLFGELGYGRLPAVPGSLQVEDSGYPISHLWGNTPVHLLGWDIPMDRRSPGVTGAARPPHAMLQELLNRSDDFLWGFLANGQSLRLLRDSRALTRQAYVEFDLEAMFDGEVYSDFVVLWLLCHQSRFEAERPEACWLEEWVRAAVEEGTRARAELRKGVERALKTLGTGFLTHPANTRLRERIQDTGPDGLSAQDYYRQLLRVVYRLLFLFVAEDRELLLLREETCKPEQRERYERYYSTARLRKMSRRIRGSAHDDLWRGVQVVTRALGLDVGAPQLALPPLGGQLWDADATPDLSDAMLRNDHFLEAIRALAWLEREKVWRPVDYRNLGAEELGSVYESLLELHPGTDRARRRFTLTAAPGSERRKTGSYYTPSSLIAELLDSALDPILDRAERSDDPETALLDLTVCDPACGSGHFLVAAAHRIADRLARHRAEGDQPTPDQHRDALRQVITRCIYGVDVNPMALELAKVNLWLEAQRPDKPLTFLDHHLQVGNSLLGTTPDLIAAGIPDSAFRALGGDDKEVSKELRKRNRKRREGNLTLLSDVDVAAPSELEKSAKRLRELADDDLTARKTKEAAWEEFASSEALRSAKLVADAWVATFFVPKTTVDGPQPFELFYALRDGTVQPGRHPVEPVVQQLVAEHRFLHWHLAFPDIFASGDSDDGGFDVVVGNPPWERVKLQEQRWFASRDPEIADARNAAERKRKIADLAAENPPLYNAYASARRYAEVESSFLGKSGRFPLGGVGDVNTYAVFTDLFAQLAHGLGRAGLIVPSGIATGHTYRKFFSYLLNSRRLVSFYGFENEDLIFPEITNKTKFGLLALAGDRSQINEVAFTGYVRQPGQIHDPERRYALTVEDIKAINPNTLTAPLFRWARDAEVTADLHRSAPVLVREGDDEGNPWHVEFLRMFDMANDSELFISEDEAESWGGILNGNIFVLPDGARLLPLYEGKMIWHYDHRYGTYAGQTKKQANKGVLPHLTDRDHQRATGTPKPRYWVPEDDVEAVVADRWSRDWFLAWRDVGINERTLVAAAIPRTAAGDKLPLMLTAIKGRKVALLHASLSSLALDYAARQKTSSAVKYFVVEQLPCPVTVRNEMRFLTCGEPYIWLASRVSELTFTSVDMAPYADELGHGGAPYVWSPVRRPVLQAELDAFILHVFELNRAQVEWLIDSFTVLRKYEERDLGEFQTKRLVLERYDAMAEAIRAGQPYQTPLDPPPAHDSMRHKRL